MTQVPVQIPPGIVVDDTTFSVGSAAWSDGDKVRFWRGQPQVIGGWERLVTTMLTGVCRRAFSWTDNDAQLNIAFGTHSNLQLFYGGQLFDITPAGYVAGLVDGTSGAGYGTGTYSSGDYSEPAAGSFYPATWSLDAYGQYLMACPRGGTIYQWQNVTASVATALSGAPANITYMLVNDERQVMAFGCNEELSGTFNPRCIRWSDSEDPTQWATLLSDTAGEFILEGSGRIVSARKVGNVIFCWTDNSLHVGTFSSTDGSWVFNLVGENCGLIGPNAAVVLSLQVAYWFGSNGQFYACPLGGVPTIIPCTMQADVFDNITPSQTDKITASSCAQFGEIRFDYPDARDGVENSRYLIYSTGGNLAAAASLSRIDTVWSKGMMVRTAYVDAGPSPYPIGVDLTGNAFYHERGQSDDGSPIDAFIESADFYLDDTQALMEIQGVWPDVASQQGPLNLTLKMRKYPQSNQRVKGPYAMAPNRSKKDFRATGRIARVRWESNAAPTFWRLGKSVFDVVEAGET